MEGYVSFVKSNRKPLFAILAVLNILALLGVLRIRINPDFKVFMPERSEYKETLDEMNQVFSTSDQMILLLEADGNRLTVDMVKKFRGFQEFLGTLDKVSHIKGPAPEKIALGRNAIIMDDIGQEDLQAVEDYYKSIGKLSPLTKKDGKIYGIFTLFMEEGFGKEELDRIEEYLKDNKLQYYVSGDLYMQQKIIDYIRVILMFLPPVALLLVLFVFRTQMGSLKATILSVLPAGLGALWTMGLAGWIGNEVSIVTVLAPIFTIVIGSADGLHFVSHVQDELRKGNDKTRSITETLKLVGIPMIITTVTSMAGFLALLIMNTDSIRDLAVFAAIGILLAGVATWYVLPLVLLGPMKAPAAKKSGKIVTYGIRRLWGIPSVVLLVVIVFISFLGLPKVKTEFNQLMVYRDYTQVYRSFVKVMEVNEGSIPVFLYAKTKGDPLDPSVAGEVLDLENELVQSGYVGKTMSIYGFYSIIHSLFIGDEEVQYPDDLRKIERMEALLSRDGDNPTSHLVDRDKKVTRVMVFPVSLDNSTLDLIEEKVEGFDEETDKVDVEVTGVQYLMRDLNKGMAENQLKTLALAFVMIFVMFFFSIKRWKPAIVSLLPIGFTVLLLHGFLGLAGISLNIITATIFSITIGVGIDYAIHFTSVWMSFKNRGMDSRQAAEKAYDYTSRPILANALGLAIGLSALLFSPLKIHVYVSALMWVSMMAGVFLSLSFLPTVLRRVHS